MIAAIEIAILARLRAASDADALGYRFRTLESYPADWDEYLKDKGEWRAPAAWVTFAGWSAGTTGDSGTARLEASFGLVLAAENLRNETATRHGGQGAAEPGSYQLLEDAVGLLAGHDLGLDIEALGVGPARSVRPFAALKERKLSMYAVQLTTAFAVEPLAFDGALASFDVFDASWDVPAFGGVDADPDAPGVQLPAHDTADAADVVELAQ